MKQFNSLQAIYKSFYSKELYRDVVNNWGAEVVLYLLLVLAICWAVTMVKMQPMLTHGMAEFTTDVAKQVPNIEIKNGVVSTPENRPYLIKDSETNELVAIIDTSGQYTKLDANDRKILLTQHEIWTSSHGGVVKIYKIPATMTMSIVPEDIKKQTIKWTPWAWVLLFPIFVLFSLVYRLVQSLLYAVIGKLLAMIGGIQLSYANVLKLTIVALTPTIIVWTVLDWFRIFSQSESLFYFILSMSYIVYAIWANKTTDP